MSSMSTHAPGEIKVAMLGSSCQRERDFGTGIRQEM